MAPDDKRWLTRLLTDAWGSVEIVASTTFNALTLPGLIAEYNSNASGVVTFDVQTGACEIVSLNATSQGKGIGTALIESLKAMGKQKGWKKLWLVTSNDNIEALRFYQKRGFRIVNVYPNAIDEARKKKPSIPLVGAFGILLKDALELEYRFG